MKEKILKILQSIAPEQTFTDDLNFIEEGILDSFDVVTLVAGLEETYGIKVDGDDVVPENFATIGDVMKLLEKYGVKD